MAAGHLQYFYMSRMEFSGLLVMHLGALLVSKQVWHLIAKYYSHVKAF